MELPSYFVKYLREIQPSRASRERAIQLHTTLRNRLSQANDAVFSTWYSGSFLYGSYIRNTSIHPIKDVDVCLLLDMRIEDCTPEHVIRRLRTVLENLGYADKTAYQHRSIRIDMSGTTLDAVPVVPIDGEDSVLHIPDRVAKEWIHTHPKAHMEAATRINKACGGRYIPLVKIVKAWYRYQAKQKRGIERPKPKGFTLEVLVAHHQDPDAPTYAEAFVNFLENLLNAYGAQLTQGIFPVVPDPGLTGENLKLSFEPAEAKLFADIVAESLALARKALAAETVGESAELWRQVFGTRFPDAPSVTKSMRTVDMSEESEDAFDAEFETEVSEIELPAVLPLTGRLKLKAQLATQQSNQSITQNYPSDSRAIAKGMWIKFSILETTVQPPFYIQWIVENHGKEAQEAKQMGHDSLTTSDVRYQWEHTQYRGTHYMICEIIKSDVVVARAQHKVAIR